MDSRVVDLRDVREAVGVAERLSPEPLTAPQRRILVAVLVEQLGQGKLGREELSLLPLLPAPVERFLRYRPGALTCRLWPFSLLRGLLP